MNGELKPIYASQVGEYFDAETTEEVMRFAQLSTPLFACTYAGKFLCMVGFIPTTILADEAYLWMNDAPAVREHPLVFARHAKRLIRDALTRYPTIVGHCDRHSAAWLRSLGAQIELPKFIIEAKHV